MNRFITGDRAPNSPKGTKMLARAYPAFDRPMILLEHVIQIRHWPMPTILGQTAFGFELHDGRRVSCVLVCVDDPRRRMVLSGQSFGQKALGRSCITFGTRGGSRSSHRWSRRPGINRPTCP